MSASRRYRTILMLLCFGGLSPGLTWAADGYVELRGYPVGTIASAGLLFPVRAQSEVGLSVLYNRTDRGDAGEHDEERGDGFGVGIEARQFYSASRAGWFYGARAELMRLEIDWTDPVDRRGRSTVTVLQPTARLGYRFALLGNRSSLELAAGLGAELNLSTEGEAVGEGAIGLLGLALRW